MRKWERGKKERMGDKKENIHGEEKNERRKRQRVDTDRIEAEYEKMRRKAKNARWKERRRREIQKKRYTTLYTVKFGFSNVNPNRFKHFKKKNGRKADKDKEKRKNIEGQQKAEGVRHKKGKTEERKGRCREKYMEGKAKRRKIDGKLINGKKQKSAEDQNENVRLWQRLTIISVEKEKDKRI
ncbi:hypothetical protein Zmor_002254 [Zophobas morio]|uniref:Uncharacterized protein n=1 Tax=Zophobas morio TaxID=2755281 RepID=A0AA38JAY9_9CUCU|nr:hypothetical protein Zmor_002254 [Zophobas morio]